MLEFAEFLTVDPSAITSENIQVLRDEGWTDEDIVDIVHVTALYNYLDRVADGLGVELPSDMGREAQVDKLSFRDDVPAKSYGDIAAGDLG